MRGNAAIFIIIGIVAVAFAGFLFYMGYFKTGPKAPSSSPALLSNDPKYQPVIEKYHLNEEQLQILSTVNQDDND